MCAIRIMGLINTSLFMSTTQRAIQVRIKKKQKKNKDYNRLQRLNKIEVN